MKCLPTKCNIFLRLEVLDFVTLSPGTGYGGVAAFAAKLPSVDILWEPHAFAPGRAAGPGRATAWARALRRDVRVVLTKKLDGQKLG